MNYNLQQLKKMLGRRYRHSLRVAATAGRLAFRHGIDKKKAEIAGLLHDCAKGMSAVRGIGLLRKNRIRLSRFEKENPGIMHASASALIAMKKFKVRSAAVLKAIRRHCFAGKEMSDLDKVVYLSDLIEPGRKLKGIGKIRRMAKKNLNRAMLMGMEYKWRYLIRKRLPVHPESIYLWNELVKRKSGK